MNAFRDELQALRNEIAELRQKNGDLGEKLAVEIQNRTKLQTVLRRYREATYGYHNPKLCLLDHEQAAELLTLGQK